MAVHLSSAIGAELNLHQLTLGLELIGENVDLLRCFQSRTLQVLVDVLEELCRSGQRPAVISHSISPFCLRLTRLPERWTTPSCLRYLINAASFCVWANSSKLRPSTSSIRSAVLKAQSLPSTQTRFESESLASSSRTDGQSFSSEDSSSISGSKTELLALMRSDPS